MRIGQGFDLHRFGEGDHLMLGGVRIPFHRGVIAHSDGDVLLHALADALLGAAGQGDIGHHFPPDDERWRDLDGLDLLRRCHQLAASSGWCATNVDLTLLAERPRVADYTAAMREQIAHCLGLPKDAVNIKGSTTEGLGAIGRGEALAALAVALLKPLEQTERDGGRT